MTLKQYLYDDIGEGVAATTANTGAAALFNTGGGSITALAAAAAQGARGLRLVTSTTTVTAVRNAPQASSKTMARTSEITVPAVTGSNNPTIWTLRSSTGSTTTILRLLAAASGSNVALTLQTLAGGTSNYSLGTYAPGTKLRIAVWVVVGTATAAPFDGVLHCRLYNTGSNTPLAAGTVDVTNVNLGTTVLDQGDFGVTAAIPESYTMDFDSDQWDDGRTTEIPQVVAGIALTGSVTPLSGTSPLTVTATVSATGGTGTPYAYVYNWGDGTTTSSSSATATHTYSAAGNYAVSCTVSNT